MTRTSSAPLDNRTTNRFGEPLCTVPTEDQPIFGYSQRAAILSAGRSIDALARTIDDNDFVDFVIGRFGATEVQLEQEFQADMNADVVTHDDDVEPEYSREFVAFERLGERMSS